MAINVRKMFIKFLILFFFFQSALLSNTTGVLNLIISYCDEVFTIFLVVYIFYQIYFKKIKFTTLEFKVTICCILLFLIGMLSSLINRIQTFFPSAVDAITCSRFMIVFVGSSIMWRTQSKQYADSIFKELNGIISFVAVIYSTLILINIFIYPIFPHNDFRIFMYSQTLFYDVVADLALVAIYGIVILAYNSRYYKKNYIYMILYTFVAISTMRYKEIAVMLLAWLLYIYYIILNKKKLNPIIIISIISIIILFGKNQFIYYYGNDETARSLLTLTSIKIANEYFPLGAGFATFASHMSRQYYSPLYAKYNLNSIYGISKNTGQYISDAFIPSLLGEFGWLGLATIFVLFYIFVKELFRVNNRYLFVSASVLLAYICVGALGTSSIFNPGITLIAIVLSNIFTVCNK